MESQIITNLAKTTSDQSLNRLYWTANSKLFCFLLLIEYHHLNPRPTNKQSDKKKTWKQCKIANEWDIWGYLPHIFLKRGFFPLRNQNAELKHILKILQKTSIDNLQRIQNIKARTNRLQRISKTPKNHFKSDLIFIIRIR